MKKYGRKPNNPTPASSGPERTSSVAELINHEEGVRKVEPTSVKETGVSSKPLPLYNDFGIRTEKVPE